MAVVGSPIKTLYKSMPDLPELPPKSIAKIELAKLEASERLRHLLRSIRSGPGEDAQVELCIGYADYARDIYLVTFEELIEHGFLSPAVWNLIAQQTVLSALQSWNSSGGTPEWKDFFVEAAFKSIKASPRHKHLLENLVVAKPSPSPELSLPPDPFVQPTRPSCDPQDTNLEGKSVETDKSREPEVGGVHTNSRTVTSVLNRSAQHSDTGNNMPDPKESSMQSRPGEKSDPSFWRDLEAQFRAIADSGAMLRADWDYIVGRGRSRDWKLTGGASNSVRVRFQSLATRAGIAINAPGDLNAFEAWLEFLREQSPNSHHGRYGIERQYDGTEGAHHMTGTIEHVCEASADQCAVLETRALEMEQGRHATTHAMPKSTVAPLAVEPQLPELPRPFQDAFEGARAQAELDFVNRGLRVPHSPAYADLPTHRVVLIQEVFFAYCAEARNACQNRNWTVAEARRVSEAAVAAICDHYFVEENGENAPEEAKSIFRAGFRKGLETEQRWKDHLKELIELARRQHPEPAVPSGRSESVIDTSPPQTATVADRKDAQSSQASHADEPAGDAEVSRRKNLLSEYKSATGNPSNKQIYGARNSGIHKPQFYEWLNAELSGSSGTAINFERFLRDKKAPIPRNPQD